MEELLTGTLEDTGFGGCCCCFGVWVWNDAVVGLGGALEKLFGLEGSSLFFGRGGGKGGASGSIGMGVITPKGGDLGVTSELARLRGEGVTAPSLTSCCDECCSCC